ncbi:MAG: hypothetical protein KGL39_34870, partial [Patescibacteria group bacterium]|nr:hypothetical protein [Patescibacteria group bacterium]
MSNAHILPDSRAHTGKQGVMMDWQMPDGTTVRVEAVHVFCANCGKLYGLVPKENTVFTFWLCAPCFEKYGAIAGTFAQPDGEFMQSVVEEMTERFGRTLTAE